MASPATFKVNLVAADRPVWSGEVKTAVIPAESGGMGILPNHEPILTVIKQGKVRLVPSASDSASKANSDVLFSVTDGFASFDSNRLTIAVERCASSDSDEVTQEAGSDTQSVGTAKE